jgi:hypothetical protein
MYTREGRVLLKKVTNLYRLKVEVTLCGCVSLSILKMFLGKVLAKKILSELDRYQGQQHQRPHYCFQEAMCAVKEATKRIN